MKSNTDSQALRSTYPNGRYRPITKEQSAEFVRRVIKRLAPLGVEPERVREGGDSAHLVWLFHSDQFGPFQVTVYERQSTCFTIFTRFVGDLSAVQAEWGKFSSDINAPTGHTGKWNIHTNVAACALEDLCYQINVVAAHKPDLVAIPA